jgi:hypothetical protein
MGKSDDCSDPYQFNANLGFASNIVALANVLSTWGRSVDGKVCDPGTLTDFQQGRQWASIYEFLGALDTQLEVNEDPSDFDFNKIKEVIEVGEEGLIVEVSREAFLATGVDGPFFIVMNSRGRQTSLPFGVVERIYALRNVDSRNLAFLA